MPRVHIRKYFKEDPNMKRIVTLMLAVMMVLSMATFAQAEEPVRIVCYTNTSAAVSPLIWKATMCTSRSWIALALPSR